LGLADDDDGTVRVVGDAVGGRAEQVVAEEVAAVPDDDEVVAVGARECVMSSAA
jgi:hypothetical protein